ncbi:MAG TPA: WYL domain-containing protein [Gemmatimonadales bacterium]|nr:WYL domain-containing protein [Gemmatimonadales bacterium]
MSKAKRGGKGTSDALATGAAEQLKRILALVPLCADDRPHRIAEVAARAGTDEATLKRDLLALSQRFDDPGAFVEGVEIFLEADEFRVRSDHFLRPMRLTLAELAALDLGLALLRSESAVEERPVIERAGERLQAALARLPGAGPDDPLHHAAYAGNQVDEGHLAELRRAIRTRRKARISYRKPDAAAAQSREVHPLGVVHASGHWYLVANGDEDEVLRVFRLDRIEEVEVLTVAAQVPPGFSVDQLFRDGKAFVGEPAAELVVRYGPRIARWIAEREGVPLEGDGSVVVRHPLADVDWAVRYVLQYGADAEVLAPDEVRVRMRERLRGIGV